MSYSSVTNQTSLVADFIEVDQLKAGEIEAELYLASDGSVSVPSYSFLADQDLGFYRPSANTLGITAGGVQSATISSTGLKVPQGSFVLPSYSFLNDANSGFCSNGTGQINVVCNNFVVSQFGANQMRSQPGTMVAPFYSFALDTTSGMYLIDLEKIGFGTSSTERLRITNSTSEFTNLVLFADGSALAPSISFTSDTDTGFYRPLSNQINVACNAAQVLNISANGLKVLDGLQTAPTYSFINDDNSGMFSGGNNVISFTAGGTTRMNISDSVITSTIPIRVASGAVTAPSYSFSADTNTGIYQATADEIDVACGSTRSVNFSFYGVKTGNGGLGSASYSFLDEVTSGMYKSSAGNLDFACGGNRGLNITASGCRTPSGTNLAPSYSFISDTDTGIYLSGTNILSIAAGGVQCMYVGPSDVTINNRLFIDGFGTNANPAMAWATDTNTGIYRSSADNFDVTAGGTRSLNINASGTYFLDGSVGSPSVSFISDPDTGLYRPGANRVAISCGGTLCSEFTTGYIANAVQIQGLAGTASAPGYSFGGDTNTGIYNASADAIGFSTNGSVRLQIGNTSSDFVTKIRGQASDTASSPTFSWVLDSDTGMYNSGANTLTFATNGIGRVSINTANLITDLPIIAPASSASAPSYTFNSDTNTGMYSYSADQIGIACGGSLVGRFFNAGFIMNGNIFTNLTPSGGTLHWYLRTNGSVLRNAIGMSATESGSDTGSNLAFWNYTDAGAFKAQIYENERSTNNNYFWGRIWAGQTGSTTIPSIGFLNQTTCGLSSYYSSQIEFITSSVHRFSITNNSILPALSASYNLGSSALLFNTIYASVGTINTSDRNLKENITDCPLGLDFVNKLKPKKYKWKDRTYEEKYYDEETKEEKTRTIEKIHSRYHCGLIAQDVKETLDELNIPTEQFAGYVDSSVNEPGINTLGLNYMQFIAPMIKAIQELSQKINDLENIVNG